MLRTATVHPLGSPLVEVVLSVVGAGVAPAGAAVMEVDIKESLTEVCSAGGEVLAPRTNCHAISLPC